MENYSLLMGAAVMKMAVEMAAVSMEKPSGHFPLRQVPEQRLCPPDLGFAMAAALEGFAYRGFFRTNLALAVNTMEEVNPQEPYRTSWSMSYPEDLEYHYNDHMAFHAKTFWVDPSKAKEDNIKRNNSSGFKSLGPKTRSCYNCGDRNHFIAQCPYEHRETRGGRLIPKDKSKDSKASNKKFYNKSKKGKRPSRIVLV
ncbi:hypothetical protein QYE76_031242 [Lolium multiflorum]|uniref:CCHC-type domain-containing protein n=1 Tax=Lolium multiflorum TaxID=4521 RepID=A0AAD8QT57_LOLMU|nr:hypothetical protein QYE76_031242 [Lolium multiflorum]